MCLRASDLLVPCGPHLLRAVLFGDMQIHDGNGQLRQKNEPHPKCRTSDVYVYGSLERAAEYSIVNEV